ncbi:MAG: GTP 3',8-cyclase MoaA [Candidatus Hadarchaeota archaeon]
MKDNYGRPVTSLRISITDRCNLNCFYCHNEGCRNADREMETGEISDLIEIATDFGIRKVKFTGGEPLIRKDILEILESISDFKLDDVSITTNGIGLNDLAEDLYGAGLDRVNVSLDTLNPRKYEEITGKPKLREVKKGIESAVETGLTPVKLNTILISGFNENEVEDLIDFAMDTGSVLQLIELEEVLPENKEMYRKYHKDLDNIEKKIEKRAVDVETRWLMQVRRKYILKNGGEVEIVNPMHNSEFCSHCTRLRITADGYLKPCLMRNDNLVDVLTPLRKDGVKEVRRAYEEAVRRREPFYK